MKANAGSIIAIFFIFVLIVALVYYLPGSDKQKSSTTYSSGNFDFKLKFFRDNEEISSIESNSQVSWILNLTNNYDFSIKDIRIILVKPSVIDMSITEFSVSEISAKNYGKVEGFAYVGDIPQDMKINLIVKTNFTIFSKKTFKVTVVSEEAYLNKLYEDEFIGIKDEEKELKSYPISIIVSEPVQKINYTYSQAAKRDFFPISIEILPKEKCISNIMLEITPLTLTNFQIECKYKDEVKSLSVNERSITFRIDPNSNQKIFCNYKYYNLGGLDFRNFDFEIFASCRSTKEKIFSVQLIRKT